LQANKILVVDDEQVIRELLLDILTGEGYTVETAPNARAALEILRKSQDFVLLFTDIMMPEMDGIELIREARRVHPDLIPIVMTGFATLETARAAVKEGAYDYVLKPFSLSEIKLAVTNAFERFRLANENARLKEINELFKISETIATIRDERQLFNFVLRAALERVEASRGSLMLLTPNGEALEIAAQIGLPDEAKNATVDIGKSISGWVAQNNKALFVENIRNVPEIEALSQRLRNESFISVPLERKRAADNYRGLRRSKGHESGVLAVLNVSEKADGEAFSDADLKILSIVANHAAAALENVHMFQEVESAHLSTLQSMALILEAKDAYTHGHSERVRNFSVLAAMRLGMSQESIDTLNLGAMLHDIGKVGVSDTVLNKIEPLSEDDWDMIKRHPVIGFDVLSPVHILREDHLALVRSHHERLDGSGYPDNLRGDDLSDLVRVIAVADSYDAMASDRAYRPGMRPDRIIEQFKCSAGVQLDARVTDLFIDLIETGEIDQAHRIVHEGAPSNITDLIRNS